MTVLTFIVIGMAALVSLLTVDAVRRWSERHRVYDQPNERSSHIHPTPRGGGLGIVTAVVVGLIVIHGTGTIRLSEANWALIGAALLVAGISFIDDIRSVRASIRFSVHLAAAMIVVAYVGYWREISLPGLPAVKIGIVGILLTCFWIVGLTNIYNFMDGIDAIAGAQALIAGLTWIVIGMLYNLTELWLIGAMIAAGTSGFLIRNWPPARVFMGDVGSAFLGFVLAGLPLTSDRKSELFLPAVLLLWPFLFDGTLTILRRLLGGENIFSAHRSHLYQRLVIAGRSHAFVAILYASLALLGSAAAVTKHPAAVGLVIAAGFGLWAFVVREERRQLERKPMSHSSRRMPSENEIGA